MNDLMTGPRTVANWATNYPAGTKALRGFPTKEIKSLRREFITILTFNDNAKPAGIALMINTLDAELAKRIQESRCPSN